MNAFSSSGLLLYLLLASSLAPLLAAPRVVEAAAPVQSYKRGVAANALSADDFRVLAPGISWYYTWSATPLSKPSDVSMEFIPMAWNPDPSFQTALANYLAAGNRPRRVFVNNEPNLKGQAFNTPQQSAALYAAIKAKVAAYNIPVVGPHMALGSPLADSISAFDPILNATTTYTTGSSFLDAFFAYAGAANVDSFAYHTYGHSGENAYFMNLYRTAYSKPLWVTEFSDATAGSQAGMLSYMMTVVDLFEQTPWIEGYAWFKERSSGIAYSDLLSSASGILTALGQAYVQMPVHDPDLYYRVPGRLQAERYVTQIGQYISPTTDSDGLADMSATASSSSLDYHLFVATPGRYTATLRIYGSTSPIKVYRDGILLAQGSPSGSGWSSLPLSFSLEAGMQHLRLSFSSASQRINWLELASASVPGVPQIIEQPAAQILMPGAAASLGCTLQSAGTYQYQWYKDGLAIEGATAATLHFTKVSAGDSGSYHVLVSNGFGQDLSAPALLSVVDTAPKPWLANISTRSYVGTGAQLQTAGFVISGSQPKKVLIRASGPTLAAAPFYVPGTLLDPVLTLFIDQTVIATSDDWSSDPVYAAMLRKAFATTYAFAFVEGSKDAALLVTLAPGNYTVQTSGKNGGTGVALVEVYEIDQSSASRLVNLSTLSPAQPGSGMQIAGFVIKGFSQKSLLIRANGPSLAAAPFFVPGTLADPQLVLFNENADELARNLDWASDATLASTLKAVFAQVYAFDWAVGSKDAALVAKLAPGNYTVQVTGQDKGDGLGLVELYEIP